MPYVTVIVPAVTVPVKVAAVNVEVVYAVATTL